MADKTPDVKLELDESARVAYSAWVAAKAAKDAADEALDAASAVLKPFLSAKGANVATIGGTPVLRVVNSSRSTFDGAILRKLAPKAAAKALKFSTFSYLKKA